MELVKKQKQLPVTKVTVIESPEGKKGDCFIRAMAFLFFKEDYDKAETYVIKEIDPNYKPKKGGVKNDKIYEWLDKTQVFKEKEIRPLGNEQGEVSVINPRKNTRTKERCTYTVGAFIKDYPKGTFLIIVDKHAFVIKDGEAHGNYGDAAHPRRRVLTAHQVAWKQSKKKEKNLDEVLAEKLPSK